MLGRYLPALLAGLLLLAFAPTAAAQSFAPATILTDPAADQQVTPGPLAVQPPAMDQVDIRDLSGSRTAGNLTFTLHTTAAVTASETVTLRFAVAHGPQSQDDSTAKGDVVTLSAKGGQVTGAEGATASVQGTSLTLTVPLAAIGATGGDELQQVNVTAEDTDPGNAPDPVNQDDSQASDTAQGGPFTIPRPPVLTGVQFTVTGGTTEQQAACDQPPCNVTERNAFSGATAGVHDGNATVRFDITITNSGSDADAFNLGIARAPAAATATLDKTSMTLLHGAEGHLELTVALRDAADGKLTVVVQATSTRGATAQVEAAIDVVHPAAPIVQERKPIPEQLGFLTPLAKGMGLDGPLGRYAELALLAFFLLLAVLVVFLVMFVTRTPWVRLEVTPRRATVSPGSTAEFRIRMSPRKKRTLLARGILRGGTTWRAGLEFASAGRVAADTPVDVALDADKPAVDGILRVQVPPDASGKDSETLELDVVPVDDEGGEHASHRARAKVTVQATPAGYASTRDIQLVEVRHDPPSPRAGATVTTTATIRNAGSSPAALRVVLQLDGKAVAEDRAELGAHATRPVVLAWTAGVGKNQVKVQVFLA